MHKLGLKKPISTMYQLERDKMKTRQDVAANYYDKKVLDDPLEIEDLVDVFLPRNERKKLSLIWTGPVKVIYIEQPFFISN